MKTKILKAAIVPVALALVFSVAWAQSRNGLEEKFSKTESLARNGRVSIVNVSGTIQVRTWEKAEVSIEAVKISRDRSADQAKENLARVTIEVVKEGDSLRIETKYPEGRLVRNNSMNVSVDYVLQIPDQAFIRVKNVSGTVDVAGIGGVLEVDVVSGGVTVVGAVQGADLRTVSGTLELRDSGGDIVLKTISGGITAEGVKGSVEAETTSGTIRLRGISGAKTVRAKALSGGIEYDGDFQAGGRYDFEVLSGRITLRLPAAAAFDLDAQSFSGSIQTDFPITLQGKISPKEMRGVVGGGGASLRVKSFSGSVRIEKR